MSLLAGILALTLPCAALVGCGRSANSPADVGLQMPEGAKWQGVYYSPIFGYLNLVQNGDEVRGAWRTTEGESWGELTGKVTGALLRYKWTNHKIGMYGPASERSGKGYFVYTRPKASAVRSPDEIHGQWGLGKYETGNKWNAIKQKNLQANLKSVIPGASEELGPAATSNEWDKPTADNRKSSEDAADKSTE
jgi:hypothetical protein